MPNSTWNLNYTGRNYSLTYIDGVRLQEALRDPSPDLLWTFIPARMREEVSITIGPGIPLILEKRE